MNKLTDVLMPTITVMQPRVINRDNTGDRSYDSEQGVIIKETDHVQCSADKRQR
jgi:hypothetical protein